MLRHMLMMRMGMKGVPRAHGPQMLMMMSPTTNTHINIIATTATPVQLMWMMIAAIITIVSSVLGRRHLCCGSSLLFLKSCKGRLWATLGCEAAMYV